MAKRRRTRTRTVFKKAKRRAKSAMSKPGAVIIPAMAYGALRSKMAVALTPVLSKIPGGNVADEIGMGLLSYMVAKKGKGMVKKVGIAGLTIESARAGEALISGGIGAVAGNNGQNPGLFL